jgi:hypothetical protein
VELRLAHEFGKKDVNGKLLVKAAGVFDLEDPSRAQEYLKRREELNAVPLMPDWNVIRIRTPETIRPAALEALAGFVEFSALEIEN